VDDLSNACLFGALEKDLGVFNGLLIGQAAVLEANPIGVVKSIYALKGLDELVWIVEVVGEGLD